MIPKNIFQIYHDKNLVPKYITENIKRLNPDYDFHFFHFTEGKKIIAQSNRFTPQQINKINTTIDELPRYCHKSDLLRYCLLYIYGGVYLDCDLKPLHSFDEFFEVFNDVEYKHAIFTSFGKGAPTFKCVTPLGIKNVHKMMANGIFASTKNNPILLDLINYCVDHPIDNKPENRGVNVIALYNILNNNVISSGNEFIEPYKVFMNDGNVIYLINQDESDEYGTNCFINEKGKVLINPNDEAYQFKRQTSGVLQKIPIINYLEKHRKLLDEAMSKYYSDDIFKKYYDRVPLSRYYTFNDCYEYIQNKLLNNDEKPVIVELGTSRSYVDGIYIGNKSEKEQDDPQIMGYDDKNPQKWDWSAGCFTKIFSNLFPELILHTIDISDRHLQRCKNMNKNRDNIKYHHTSSEDFLNNFPQKIDLLYLDTGNLDEETAQLHLREVKIIVEKDILKKDGLLLIDDVRNPYMMMNGEKSDLGKSKYSVPYLLDNGYKIIENEYQMILKKYE